MSLTNSDDVGCLQLLSQLETAALVEEENFVRNAIKICLLDVCISTGPGGLCLLEAALGDDSAFNLHRLSTCVVLSEVEIEELLVQLHENSSFTFSSELLVLPIVEGILARN